jgi:hypothetical protein
MERALWHVGKNWYETVAEMGWVGVYSGGSSAECILLLPDRRVY